MFCRIPVTSLGALQKLSGPMPLPTPMAAHMSPGVAAPMSFPTPVGMRWRAQIDAW